MEFYSAIRKKRNLSFAGEKDIKAIIQTQKNNTFLSHIWNHRFFLRVRVKGMELEGG